MKLISINKNNETSSITDEMTSDAWSLLWTVDDICKIINKYNGALVMNTQGAIDCINNYGKSLPGAIEVLDALHEQLQELGNGLDVMTSIQP